MGVRGAEGVVLDADSVEQTTLKKAYDALGNLDATTTAGSTINHTYDLRGRGVQTVDPDMGTWTYAYNGFGELMGRRGGQKLTCLTLYLSALTIQNADSFSRPDGSQASPGVPGRSPSRDQSGEFSHVDFQRRRCEKELRDRTFRRVREEWLDLACPRHD